jgi:putrescine transport system permease protein
MLAFTLSLDDLVIASFTSGPGATTLPMRLYSQVRLGVDPKINAVSTLLIGAVAVGVLAAGWLQGRGTRMAQIRATQIRSGAAQRQAK